MNKSIVIGALIIGVAIIASPLVFDKVKSEQVKSERAEFEKAKEIADVIALGQAADFYFSNTGKCPETVEDLMGTTIKRLPLDRFGLDYNTTGDCKFVSSSGITEKSY